MRRFSVSTGNFGIVTEMTIALARRPECVEGFYFWVPADGGLENAVEAVHEILLKLGSTVGAINLMDRRRQISMTVPYPFDRVAPNTIMTGELVEEIGRRNDLPDWLGFGTLYGDRRMVKAARAVIRECLKGASNRVIFLAPVFAQRLLAVSRMLPFLRDLRAVRLLPKLVEGLKIACGIPSEIALPLTIWKNPRQPTSGRSIDPLTDGTGLIWYTPLIPMRATDVRTYVNLLRSVCQEHSIEPLITLTSVSERCFDSSVPLLFDKENAVESERAELCYRALFAEGQRAGFVPYRYGVDHMELLFEPRTPFWELVARLKSALDPAEILSPGRYAPSWRDRPVATSQGKTS